MKISESGSRFRRGIWQTPSLDSRAFGALLAAVFALVIGLFGAIAWTDPDPGTSTTAAAQALAVAALPQ